jgi:signal peptidase II
VTDRPDNEPDPSPEAPDATPATAPSAEAQAEHPRRVALLAVVALSVVALDLITKIIAVALLTPGESPRILGGLVYFSLIRNPGAAFSMATGMTWLLALVAIGVVVVIIRMAPRLRSTAWAVSLGLVLGGACGNLIDRIFRAPGFLQGHVVDFVSVFGPNAQYFPVFNVADSAITIGGISLVVTALLGIDFDGTRTKDRKKDAASTPQVGTDRG